MLVTQGECNHIHSVFNSANPAEGKILGQRQYSNTSNRSIDQSNSANQAKYKIQMRDKQKGTKAGLALAIYNSGKLFLHKVLNKLAYFKLCARKVSCIQLEIWSLGLGKCFSQVIPDYGKYSLCLYAYYLCLSVGLVGQCLFSCFLWLFWLWLCSWAVSVSCEWICSEGWASAADMDMAIDVSEEYRSTVTEAHGANLLIL